MQKKASILIPTFCHGPMLNYSVRSALNQTIEDIEVLVIGDGTDETTHSVMAELMKEDARVRYFPFPKGPRNGETHRHKVLTEEAQGEIVCYLSDDDLYFPNHVELVYEALKENDFVITSPFNIAPDNSFHQFLIQIENDWYRDLILKKENRIPLSNGNHTMELYKKLPYGWRTTPVGIYTDWYMWQQILGMSDVKALTINEPTVLHFSSSQRRDFSPDERVQELKTWYELSQNPQELATFVDRFKKDRVSWPEREMTRLRQHIEWQQPTIDHLSSVKRNHDEDIARVTQEKETEIARLHEELQRASKKSAREKETLINDLQKANQRVSDLLNSRTWRLKNAVVRILQKVGIGKKWN